MFSSDPDTRTAPWLKRLPVVALSSVILLGVVASLVSARTTPGAWAFACLAVFIATLPHARSSTRYFNPTEVLGALIGFSVFAVLSALWAENPLAPVRAGGFLLLTVLITHAALNAVPSLPSAFKFHMAEGLWLGLLIGLTYFLIELLTSQAIKISIYNLLNLAPGDIKPTVYFTWSDDGTLQAISINDMTRNTAPITLFLWPAMLAAIGATRPPLTHAIPAILLALAAACVALSPHETSKIAFIASLVVFAVSYATVTWTRRTLTAGWTAACLLIVPIALLAHDMKLHEHSALQNSVRARLIIWNETATETLKTPILGVGARMTYEIGPRRLAQMNAERKKRIAATPAEQQAKEWFPRKLSRHAHNAFLQTWYELGAVGILLFLAGGVFVINTTARMTPRHQPFALATFAAAMTLAASSYGMWQAWFVALFALTPIFFAIAQAVSNDDAPAHD